jgi:hypothetical protein
MAVAAAVVAGTNWETRWTPIAGCVAALASVWAGRRSPVWRHAIPLLALGVLGWKLADRVRPRNQAEEDAALISALVSSEETLLKLGPRMAALSKGMMGLHLPGSGTRELFAPSVRYRDLGPGPAASEAGDNRMETRQWGIAPESPASASPDLWRPLLDGVEAFDHAKFTLLDGESPSGDPNRFSATAAFEGLAHMKSGEWRAVHARLRLLWQRGSATAADPDPAWRIAEWQTEEMLYQASARRLFVEVMESAFRPTTDFAKVRHSAHYDATLKYYREGMKTPPHPYFAPISANQKEGLAIVDVDGDGFDDIYLMVRIGSNLFLHNNGDGTFTEEAAARGLALPGHSTCGIFADFDNDGDPDLILGRSLLRTAYLENRGGKFYQYPSPKHFPMAVISMSAADYNRDGLLDVYLCTYRPAAPTGASPAGGVMQVQDGAFDWPDEFLSAEDAKEFRRRMAEQKQHRPGYDSQFPDVLDQLGPPNVLLVNRGKGWFEVAPENPVVGVWRNSLQATWCDYNNDGWPDLYIANDWAMDNMFRNDGGRGFTEVSGELGFNYYGYAMGASWGDYDNDGRDDLYVSNMYSRAGRRITGRIPGLNRRFAESAAGNWLYHAEPDGKYRQVAGLEAPAMRVMNAGWSWGGCFADFDNDGFLDLYVLSGYSTAPKELDSELDIESNLWRTMVRTDASLSRDSFRFSPEWKRTRGPEMVDPQMDARLAGVERRGDQMWVHSLNGKERNHYFANRGGRSFDDLSALSGLDNIADSRGFALFDYDRDGWQDVVLVNANQPQFNLYHNDMPSSGFKGGMIAIRFVGGNKTPLPSRDFTCRDGYGARVFADLGDMKITREHRCGDGWSVQHSSTMILGIGSHATVPSLTVRWPSGKKVTAQGISEGMLVTFYENPADSPTGVALAAAPYRIGARGSAAAR